VQREACPSLRVTLTALLRGVEGGESFFRSPKSTQAVGLWCPHFKAFVEPVVSAGVGAAALPPAPNREKAVSINSTLWLPPYSEVRTLTADDTIAGR